MDAETWIAISAALIAAAALFFNGLSTRAAMRAARAADEQTAIQRQIRVDSAQPYVWVDVRPDESTGTLLNLVVGNSGPTLATNVRVRIDPPLPTIDQLKDRATQAQKLLGQGVQSLPPGRTMVWPLGQGFNLLKGPGSQVHRFSLTADGPFGPIPELTYAIDLSDWRGVLDRPRGSLHQLTKAVEDLGKKVENER